MNRILLLFVSFLILHLSSIAQNQVFLNIHHKLGENDFALNSPAKNNMDHDFEVTRMEYYISGISIVHDNGLNTSIDSLWILVNANAPTQVDLGNYPITHVEAIHFYIGVDPGHNHLDPASFDPSHPLAPKNPSMHWGWASGYRFMAFEGNGGSNYDQLIQLHGLGDQNYIKNKLLLQATADNNQVSINLDADYTRVLEDLSVNAGLIVHSELLEAQQALENLRTFVFSPAEDPTGTRDIYPVKKFDVYPNPSVNGQSTVSIELDGTPHLDMSITDVVGKQVVFYGAIDPNMTLDLSLLRPGIYFIHVFADGRPLISKQLISN